MPAPCSLDTRVRIVAALIEGNSLRATARMVGVDKDTAMATALLVGEGCARLHSRLVRGVAAHVVQMDEQWSFVQKKQARVTDKDPSERGDAYSYIAIDANTKLVLSFHVGKRDAENTMVFVSDLRARLTVKPHVSSDGWRPYIDAVWSNFAGAVDYGQVVKNYRTGSSRGPDHRYEPPRDPFITKTPVIGVPTDELMSTSYVERFNLTTRHMVGRTRRLCLAFSKTLRGHAAAMALGIVSYNLVKAHGTLGTTPAVAAGLVEHPWSLAELVIAALAEEETAAPIAVPLKFEPRPGEATGPVRELPGGRGWLRVVDGGKSDAVSKPPMVPPSVPAASTVQSTATAFAVSQPATMDPQTDPSGQLDLFAWKPKPRSPTQLSLFGEPEK